MILNKYNEIMNNVTVDPEMKSRIMGAVFAAIKEQANSAKVTEIPKDKKPVHESGNKSSVRKADVKPVETRKKAKKAPIAIISSIAAGVLIIAGVLFVMKYLNSAEAASTKIDEHNAHVDSVAMNTVANENYEETVASLNNGVEDAEGTEPATDGYLSGSSYNYAATTGDDERDLNTKTVDIDITTRSTEDVVEDNETDESEVMGDARLDRISRALPFDLKGSGSGVFSDTITEEVFFGVNGEKVIVCSAPEGTDDLIRQVFHQTPAEGLDGTSPFGVPAKLYRVTFGNVTELTGDEVSSDVNAAVFVKNGKTYLIVFSDIQPAAVILKLVDAV